MHELSLCQALIDQVEKEVAHSGYGGRVVGVELLVGWLSGVHCDSLRFAFEQLAPGTIVAEAQLNISNAKATCHCRGCGVRLESDGLLAECPRCGSAEVVIEGGRELLLQSIEIED